MAWYFSPCVRAKGRIRGRRSGGMETVGMEVRVHLKVCEGCGCLWFRAQTQVGVYCRACAEKLREFPSPESRKRRGRPTRKPHMKVWKEAEAVGGGL